MSQSEVRYYFVVGKKLTQFELWIFFKFKMKVVIPSTNYRHKKMVFSSHKASNDPMTKTFALGRLQVTPFNPPLSKRSRVSHLSNTSWPKLSFLQKMGKKCLYFWSQKIAVIQAKLFLIKFFRKKSNFSMFKNKNIKLCLWIEWYR